MADKLDVVKSYRQHLYHITHINNVKSIILHGLKSHNRANDYHEPTDISLGSVQERRFSKPDPCYGRLLHDYVPLFFQARGPMLYRRLHMREELVIFLIERAAIMQERVVFTDGNAASNDTRFYQNIDDLVKLDWRCLDAPYWRDFEDGRRKRAAEVLVPDHLPRGFITGIYVVNREVKEKVKSQISPRHLLVEVNRHMFFD